MNMQLSVLWQRYHELVVYCLIGATGATLDFLIYSTLTIGFGFHYQLANFLSVSIGVVNNFFWNYFFNFRMRNNILVRLAIFYLVGMLGWALSAGCLWLFVDLLNINALAAKLGTIVVVTIVQFCLNKYIIFRRCN